MIDITGLLPATIDWRQAVRIINTRYPPIDLFEDIADPEDWPLLISAEQKTNPRLVDDIGNLDLVPPGRRVGGAGASYLMAPFTHTSPDRPSRFSDGHLGVLHVANRFDVALFETIHHHTRFMAATNEPAGRVTQFREIMMHVSATLSDLRPLDRANPIFALDDYTAGQALAARLRVQGSDGVVYPSMRFSGGECAGLFYPDCASAATQGRHLEYHWNGTRIDYYQDLGARQVFRLD